MSTSTEGWRALAATHSRDEFAAAYDYPFLLSLGGLDVAPRPMPTLRMYTGPDAQPIAPPERRRTATPTHGPTVLPVRKVQANFPSMITLGRARNNDVVVPDTLISKFHAFFRLVDGVWTLADAGSVNGTRIGDQLLVPKGAAEPVRSGDRLRFGAVAFQFCDAAGLWSALHSHR